MTSFQDASGLPLLKQSLNICSMVYPSAKTRRRLSVWRSQAHVISSTLARSGRRRQLRKRTIKKTNEIKQNQTRLKRLKEKRLKEKRLQVQRLKVKRFFTLCVKMVRLAARTTRTRKKLLHILLLEDSPPRCLIRLLTRYFQACANTWPKFPRHSHASSSRTWSRADGVSPTAAARPWSWIAGIGGWFFIAAGNTKKILRRARWMTSQGTAHDRGRRRI